MPEEFTATPFKRPYPLLSLPPPPPSQKIKKEIPQNFIEKSMNRIFEKERHNVEECDPFRAIFVFLLQLFF